VQKVIVLMTDGFNTWASKTNKIDQSDYEGPGYFANADDRLPPANRGTLVAGGAGTGAPSASSYGSTTAATNARAALDALTLEACTNARTAGVSIYAIGFSVTGDLIDTQGQNMLKACTGDNSKVFIAANATALNAAFSNISNGLGRLRLVSP
jgi:hypothetical protein